jgi:flagellar motor component MotA
MATVMFSELHMDKASVGGAVLAIAGIITGLLIEGGNVGQILQPTAALIVFGGTMGAVLLQFPLTTVVDAFRSLGHVFARRATRRGVDWADDRIHQQGPPPGCGLA